MSCRKKDYDDHDAEWVLESEKNCHRRHKRRARNKRKRKPFRNFCTFSHYDVGQVAMSVGRCLHQKTYQFSHPRTCTLIGYNRFIANICFSASALIPALAKNSNEELWNVDWLDFYVIHRTRPSPAFLTPILIFSRRTQPISSTRQTHHHCLSDTFGLHSKMDCFQPLVLAGFLYSTLSFRILTVGAYFHAESDGYLVISCNLLLHNFNVNAKLRENEFITSTRIYYFLQKILV